MRSLMIASSIVLFGLQSLACKRTPESAARAEEAAVREHIKADKKWAGYTIESLKRNNGVFRMTLKKKSKVEKLILEATTSPDCKISVDLPTGP